VVNDLLRSIATNHDNAGKQPSLVSPHTKANRLARIPCFITTGPAPKTLACVIINMIFAIILSVIVVPFAMTETRAKRKT
jgi:hypothetical protein